MKSIVSRYFVGILPIAWLALSPTQAMAFYTCKCGCVDPKTGDYLSEEENGSAVWTFTTFSKGDCLALDGTSCTGYEPLSPYALVPGKLEQCAAVPINQ